MLSDDVDVLLFGKDAYFAPQNKMKRRDPHERFYRVRIRDLALPHSSSLVNHSRRVGRHTKAVCRPHFVGQFDLDTEERALDCPCSDPCCPRSAKRSENDDGGGFRRNRNRNGGYRNTFPGNGGYWNTNHDPTSNYSFIIGGDATEKKVEVEKAEHVGLKDQSYGCGKNGGYRKKDKEDIVDGCFIEDEVTLAITKTKAVQLSSGSWWRRKFKKGKAMYW